MLFQLISELCLANAHCATKMFPQLDRNVAHVEDKILSYLEPKELAKAMLVCKEWCEKARPFLYEWYATIQRKNGDIPLIKAVISDNDHLVAFLLRDRQVNVNEINETSKFRGWTALTVAAFNEQETITRMLLEREDTDVNMKSRLGRSALHYAASWGHAGIVKILLERRDIHVNDRDKLGFTPLIEACREMRVSVAKELLNHPDIDVNIRDINGNTALSLAKRVMSYNRENSLIVEKLEKIVVMLEEKNAILETHL